MSASLCQGISGAEAPAPTGAGSETRRELTLPLASVRRKHFWKYRMTCLVCYFLCLSPETFLLCFETFLGSEYGLSLF